jgi:hypothetical protein
VSTLRIPPLLKSINHNTLGRLIDLLCISSSPARRAPTSSSYVIILRHPLCHHLPKSNLYIQDRDEKLITIGNKPVLLQSLILTSGRQVLVPQASVQVTRFVTATTPAVPGTLFTVPGPLLKQLSRL